MWRVLLLPVMYRCFFPFLFYGAIQVQSRQELKLLIERQYMQHSDSVRGEQALPALMATHRAHVMRVCALLQEEAATLARCTLLEELIEEASAPRPVVDRCGATASSPRIASCERSAKRARNDDVSLKHGAESSPVRTAAGLPEVSAAVVEVIVEDESPPTVQCTPSEILEECEMLFGGPSTGLLALTTGNDASGAKHNPAAPSPLAPKLGEASGGGVRAQAKSALRGAYLKKERHPRALVPKQSPTDIKPLPPQRNQTDEANSVATGRHHQPQMTPDAYWDVGMDDIP